MSAETDALVLDLLEWLAARPRAYDEVMDAWRTSCPRLTIWEDAVDQGLVMRDHKAGTGALVRITTAGLAHLEHEGRPVPYPAATT
jgi:hypothetical protein